MAKPVPVEVKSDDCTVTVNGVAYTPHEGESVWLFQGQSVGEMRALGRLMGLQTVIDGAKGEKGQEAAMAVLRAVDEAFDDICAMLAPRVVSWNWTDLRGDPLPQPDGSPDGLARLESEELFWLLQAARGDNRPNG